MRRGYEIPGTRRERANPFSRVSISCVFSAGAAMAFKCEAIGPVPARQDLSGWIWFV